MKILFMCVANSARSQMAEGLAKEIFADRAEIQSAGSKPTRVNPFAVRALAQIDIDISSHHSKTFDGLPEEFKTTLDYVITLCAEEVCPVVISKSARKLHWPFMDPAGHSGSDAEQLARFVKIRDQIKNRIEEFAKSI
jgi:arsenate reductase (thioredoxin)